jgi:lambda family phage portal protein
MSLLSTIRTAIALNRAERAAKNAARTLSMPAGKRVYLAAASHRLLGAWGAASISADLELQGGQNTRLRARARDVVQNTSLGARYAQMRRDNIVGPLGPSLRVQFPDAPALNKKIETDVYEWGRRCTPDGRSLREVLTLLAEARGVEGEGFLEMRVAARSPYGMLVQPYEADYCDDNDQRELPGGRRVVNGVQFGPRGEIEGYWMFDEHPSSGRRRRSEFVSAAKMLRHANRRRIAQARGVSKMAPVLVLLHHLERLQEALVVLHRVCASKMGYFVQTKDDALPLTPPKEGEIQRVGPQPGNDEPVQEVEPGAMGALAYGWEAQLFDPGQPTQQFDAMAADMKREVASGFGVSPHALTGDYRNANYGSQRASLEPERDMWRGEQAALEEDILAPLLAEFVRLGVVAGRYNIPGYTAGMLIPSTWDHRIWNWIDPLKDAQTLLLKLRNGMTTLTEVLGVGGKDLDEQIAVIKTEREKCSQAGISLEFMAAALAAPAPTPADDAEDDDDVTDTTDGASTPRLLPARAA